MHLSKFKTPIDFGRNKLSASISFLIVKAILLTYLRCFVSHLVRPCHKYQWDNHLSPNLGPECLKITTRQLDALTVLSTHYVSNNCIYFQLHLPADTNSIAIDLMTMKDFFLSIGHQQSAISSCQLLWLPVIANDLSIPQAPENMSHKDITTIHFHNWT